MNNMEIRKSLKERTKWITNLRTLFDLILGVIIIGLQLFLLFSFFVAKYHLIEWQSNYKYFQSILYNNKKSDHRCVLKNRLFLMKTLIYWYRSTQSMISIDDVKETRLLDIHWLRQLCKEKLSAIPARIFLVL